MSILGERLRKMKDFPESGYVFTCDFANWRESVPRLLDAAGLGKRLAAQRQILVKPNLVEALKPPVTTPVELIAALIDYIRANNAAARIIVGEGTGSLSYNTSHPFEFLGYTRLAQRYDIELMDLNEAPVQKIVKPACRRWPEMYLPRVVFESFLVSVPVLKAHTLAGVTLTMKNMMGIAPPAHYQQNGRWKKASFHERIHEAIADLNRYRTPDFTLLDATVGMREAHLWGATCRPAPNLLAAAFDPVAIDAFGAGVLKRNWQDIGHIAMTNGELGRAEPLDLRRE